MVGTYSLRDAARILKVSPRRLRHWERTVLARLTHHAEVDDTAAFEFRDLVCARAVLGLIDQGIPLARIRRSVDAIRETLPELDDPVGSLRVWARGSARVVVDHGGQLLQPDGQMVLDFRDGGASGSPVLALEDKRPETDAGEAAVEWFERGCALDSESETYAEAVDAYRRAIEAVPEMADAHCNLGAVLYNQGRRAESRDCFERCLEIEPWHVEANFNLANVLEESGDDREALRHYLNALKGDPMYADLHVNLGLLFEKLGERGRAAQHWRRYLQLDPNGAWSEVARTRASDS